MMLARVSERQARASTKSTGFDQSRPIKKPHTKLPAGGFTMEACVIADGLNCTAFVQKAGSKP
jgi:hypothetical protein